MHIVSHAVHRSLVIARHARAEAHDPPRDLTRHLCQEGRWQAEAVGGELAQTGWAPQLALVSVAARTRETWEIVARSGGFDGSAEFLDSLYGGWVPDMIDAIHAVDDGVTHLLLIGHEPATSATAAWLAGPGSDEAALCRVRRGLPTGGRAHLSYSGPWSEIAATRAQLTGFAKPGV